MTVASPTRGPVPRRVPRSVDIAPDPFLRVGPPAYGARVGSNAPSGWYRVGPVLRWWDGVRWTDHVAPLPVERSSTAGGWVVVGIAAVASVVVATAAAAAVGGAVAVTSQESRVEVGSAKTSSPSPSAPTATPSALSPAPPAPSAPSSTARPTRAPRPSPARTTAPAPAAGTALALLATLPVKGRAPRTGYDRDLFGQAWADVDRNGCDTRNDVLRRDLTSFTLKAGTNGCLVLSGTLRSPYTGKTRPFVRGRGTSSAVQVDHVVALSDAWQKGARQLDAERRTAFANDPLNLLAVEGSVNQAKGDGDAATWLPPLKSSRCAYVARQVAVKAKYRLWVTGAERDAVTRVLSACPGQKPPTASRIALGGGRVVSPPQHTPAPEPTAPAPLVGGRTDPRFDTCKAAKAAGYGPYVEGEDPEYDWYRDADSDGIVCE